MSTLAHKHSRISLGIFNARRIKMRNCVQINMCVSSQHTPLHKRNCTDSMRNMWNFMGNLANKTKWAQFSSNRYVCYGGKSELLEFRCENRISCNSHNSMGALIARLCIRVTAGLCLPGDTREWTKSTPCDAAVVHKNALQRCFCALHPPRQNEHPKNAVSSHLSGCHVTVWLFNGKIFSWPVALQRQKTKKKNGRKSGQKRIRTCSRTQCAAHCLVGPLCPCPISAMCAVARTV